jgi:outer membrane receptor protein involved in Fe transport
MFTHRQRAQARARAVAPAMLLASTMLAGVTPAFAAPGSSQVQELIVTAQKREENVQKVPLSIQVLTTQKLQQLQVSNFNDYVKYLPSVAFQGGNLGASPGFSNVYMRGVASGNDGNHSGSLPSVGVYLDEQPITTIGGTLDIHVYDIARVESLAGPQGTLYGASSEAGTVRIITNQPQIGAFSAAYDIEGNKVDHGGWGYSGEGYENIPISDKAAIRLVAWGEHDAGYIDNVHGTRTYPTSGITIDNAARAKKDYNTNDLYGGRAALKIDLDDNWTITPTVMAQSQYSHGNFSYDPSIGDLQVKHFLPEYDRDRWLQAALTVHGKISNFDLVYAGSFMARNTHVAQDYTDYSFFYDQLYGYGTYIYDNSHALIDPSQWIVGRDHFGKQSHEFRISSPGDQRLRVVAGLFYERQTHFIEQRYEIQNLADSLSVTGWPNTLWLTEQNRVDRDYAAFGEATFDITQQLKLTGGVRVFKSTNSLIGFFGFSAGYSSHTGESQCFGPPSVGNGPCTNLNKSVSDTGETHKVNLTYQIDDQKMVYATYSTGFRPGGVNRRGTIPPYLPDTLTNYEAGWKTSWLDGKVRFNGSAYWEKWKNAQFSVLGLNSFTEIRNVGAADIKGFDLDLSWRPDDHWSITAAGAYTDAKITSDYCGINDPTTHAPITVCPGPVDPNPPEAPKGTALPVTPKFKATLTARYEWEVGPFKAHLQGDVSGQTFSWADLRLGAPDPVLCDLSGSTIPVCAFKPVRSALGKQRGYAITNFTTGLDRGAWWVELSLLNAFDTRADLFRYAECTPQVCGSEPYINTNRPRTIALKIGQRF